MTSKDTITAELNELSSSLVSVSRNMPYHLPQGYFDGLASAVISRIKALEAGSVEDELNHLSPLLNRIPKTTPYITPEGYFNEPVTNHKEQTAAQELAELSPLLSSIKKDTLYSVPYDYFDELAKTTLARVKETGKVIPLGKRNWLRYAAAAVTIGIISIAAFLLVNQDNAAEKQLAAIEKDAKKMSEEEKDDLVDFLDAGLTGTETAANNNTDEVADLLKGLSEKELNEFLAQTEDIEDVLSYN